MAASKHPLRARRPASRANRTSEGEPAADGSRAIYSGESASFGRCAESFRSHHHRLSAPSDNFGNSGLLRELSSSHSDDLRSHLSRSSYFVGRASRNVKKRRDLSIS